MIATLFSTGQLNAPLGLAVALAVGFCFGLCLEKAGLGSSRRLSGLFLLTDMTLAKVLLSALVTAALGLVAAQRSGLIGLDAFSLISTTLAPQALGGAIFGLGFALAGWCPGTAAVGLGSGRMDALVFLAGVVLGSIVYGEAFPWLAPLASVGGQGVTFLNQTLNATTDQVVLGLTGAAVFAFWVCEVVERGPAIARPGVGRLFLAGFSALLCLGSLVALNLPRVSIPGGQHISGASNIASNNTSGQANGRTTGQNSEQTTGGQNALGVSPEARILADAEAGKGRLEPVELARRLMARDPGLTLVDLRPKAEFDAFHLAGASNISMSQLPEVMADKRGQGLIVLCAAGTTRPAQARDALARLGFDNVVILGGGLQEFFEQVLKPASLRDELFSAEAAAKIQTARQFFLPAELSRPQAPGLLTPPGPLPGLADATWLAQSLNKPGLKVVDLRPAAQYDSGHIPDSLSLVPDNLRGNVGGLPSQLLPGSLLARHLGLMGITPRDLVVLITGRAPQDATLAAMALERLGHSRYVLLKGGMAAWTASSLSTDKALPKVTATRYPAPETADDAPDAFTVNGLEVLTAMTDGKTVIIDASPADAYSGDLPGDGRSGHIPGSVNRPFTEDQAAGPADTVTVRPLDELAKAYAAIIPGKDRPVIVLSRTGRDASQTWWILSRLLGYTNVKYYGAGWAEWASHPEWPAVASPPPAKQDKKS